MTLAQFVEAVRVGIMEAGWDAKHVISQLELRGWSTTKDVPAHERVPFLEYVNKS